jgi:hypothetical protein
MENSGFPFRDFLQNNSAYGGLCGSFFAKPFHGLLITAFEFRHQIELHLKSQQISSELSERKDDLFGCMEFILSHVEETYASEVRAAFDAFKKAHQNDEPIFSLQELNAGLDFFLKSVFELEGNSPPPHKHPKNNRLCVLLGFWGKDFLG